LVQANKHKNVKKLMTHLFLVV